MLKAHLRPVTPVEYTDSLIESGIRFRVALPSGRRTNRVTLTL